MTVKIALFLSSDGIALAHRQRAGHWAMIGEAAFGGDDQGAAMAALKSEAVDREGEAFETLLVLPDDQILYTSLTVPTGDPELTVFRIEEGLDGLTPYTISELEYDWRVTEADRVKIAVVARETLDEARGFAKMHGFSVVGFAAMPIANRFPGAPLFDMKVAADSIDFAETGIALGMDTHGQPEPEPEPDPEPVVEPDPEPDPLPEPEPVAEATPEPPEPGHGETAPTAAAMSDAEPMPADYIGDDLRQAAPQDTAPEPASAPGVETAAPDAPDTAATAALADALSIGADDAPTEPTPIEDPTLGGPVAPNDGADPTPIAAEDEVAGLDDIPPAPPPAARATRAKVRVIRGKSKQKASDGAPQSAPRKGRGTSGPAEAGRRDSRLGLTGVRASDEAQPDDPTEAATTGAASPMPRLSEQLKRVRAASKARPGAPAPSAAPPTRAKVNIEPRPPEASAATSPSPFDAPPETGSAGRSGMRALLGGGRKTEAQLSAERRALTATRGPAELAPVADGGEVATAEVGEDPNLSSGLMARRSVEGAGPSFKTGLILTVILLVLLALVAIWSALFLPNSPVARLLGLSSEPELAATAPNVGAEAPAIGLVDPAEPTLEDEAAADGVILDDPDLAISAPDPLFGDDANPTEVAALEPGAEAPPREDELPDIDAELDLPPLPPMPQDLLPSVEEAQEIYDRDGIWSRTPDRPNLLPFDLLDRVYTASIDPEVQGFDAVALPDPGVNPGEALRNIPPPPPFGTEFQVSDEGLIAPTPDGVVTPEGARVVAGNPPLPSVPRPREIAAPPPIVDVSDAIIGAFRPVARPTNLNEIRERQILGGLTEDELGARRPEERPLSPQEAAARASLFPSDSGTAEPTDEPAPDAAPGTEPLVIAPETGTDLAVLRSIVPPLRPTNIADIVATADRQPVEEQTVVVAAAAVAPGPDIPSNADVTRAATESNAIRLRNVNLIGVTGTPSDRRALIRLSSGRFVRVAVGDRLDGGRVAAIGESTLQYVRNGRTVTLEIPG